VPEISLTAGTIDYQDTGGEGPVVVLLHGLLMNHLLWREVMPALTPYRCVLPTLPLGAHRRPMHPNAELGLWSQVELVAEFLDALDLRDVTLVSSDWGGGTLLTAARRDERIARLVICAGEAFDNYPPGLPGKAAALGAKFPGGITLALRQLRLRRLRRSPLLFGWMAKRPLPDDIFDAWTAPGLRSPEVRRDLRKYARAAPPKADLDAATNQLRRFDRPTLIVWGTEDKVMPIDHARRLAALLPDAELVEVDDAYTLLSFDRPDVLTSALTRFLERTTAAT
jgi:pimeloyl-ACP methyl ester carboxylesterase